MVYSTDRSKAVVPVLVLLFVALWFVLRGDLFYVLPCVILFLCFLVLLALRLPRLGKRELIVVLFVRLFDLCLFGFVLFPLPLGVWEGLWFVICGSLRFVICGSPRSFLLPFVRQYIPRGLYKGNESKEILPLSKEAYPKVPLTLKKGVEATPNGRHLLPTLKDMPVVASGLIRGNWTDSTTVCLVQHWSL